VGFNSVKLAVGAVVTHHEIERGDSSESNPRGLRSAHIVVRVEENAHRQAHVNFGEFDASQRPRMEDAGECWHAEG
jgi:hypothetical protein